MEYRKKISALYDKLFKQNFNLDGYYCEHLLRLLDTPDKRGVKVFIAPYFTQYTITALTNLENTTNTHFLIGILRLMFSNEMQLCIFAHMPETRPSILKLCSPVSWKNSNLRLMSTKLVTDILCHSSGITFVKENKLYENIVAVEYPHSLASLNATCDFVSKFAWALDEFDDEASLTEFLTFLVRPIQTSKYMIYGGEFVDMYKTGLNREFAPRPDIIELNLDMEFSIYKQIGPYLKGLLAILDDTKNIVRVSKILPILNDDLLVEPALITIVNVSRHQELLSLACDILFRLNCGSITLNAIRNNKLVDVPQEATMIFYNFVNVLSHRSMVHTLISYTASCIRFWSKLDKAIIPRTFDRYERTFDVQFQFLVIAQTPLLTCSQQASKAFVDCLDAYYYKISKNITEYILKAGYIVGTLVQSGDCIKTCIDVLKHLFTIKSCLNENYAGYMFQTLFYVLTQYVSIDDKGDDLIVLESPLACTDAIKVISMTMELIKMLLTDYDIKWYESVEIVSLQNCLMNLLKQNVLPVKLVLQALDLIDLSVRNFLSPDLALLIESRRGSTLNEIMMMMQAFISHPEWEVRDSALHLLLTCTKLAFVKYRPLQKLLHASNLMIIAAEVALKDQEAYVQATALRCLAAATKVEVFWQQVNSVQPDLHIQLINILQNNPEGIIRKETANVLTELYTHQKLSQGLIALLYDVMMAAALKDLHWEVQLVALRFWKVTLYCQTANRGMIDGKFPTATFSREKRKIIILKPDVIQTELMAIMNDLANIGCLMVLFKCLEEDNNIQVIETAFCITKELMTILENYDVEYISSNMPSNDDFVDYNGMEVFRSDDFMDIENRGNFAEVLDMITNSFHSELILDLAERCNVVEDAKPINLLSNRKVSKWMDPNDFIKHYKDKDYENMIDKKANWNTDPKNLEELLNEILSLKDEKAVVENFKVTEMV